MHRAGLCFWDKQCQWQQDRHKRVAAITVNSANTKNAYGIYSTGANSDIAFHSDTILTTNGPAAVQVEAGGKVLLLEVWFRKVVPIFLPLTVAAVYKSIVRAAVLSK